jgi:hypothetical protein
MSDKSAVGAFLPRFKIAQSSALESRAYYKRQLEDTRKNPVNWPKQSIV